MGLYWLKDNEMVVQRDWVHELQDATGEIYYPINSVAMIFSESISRLKDYKKVRREQHGVKIVEEDKKFAEGLRMKRLFLAYKDGLIPEDMLAHVKKEIFDWQTKEYNLLKEDTMFGLTHKQIDELAEFVAERIEESGPLMIKEIFKEFTREQVKKIARNEVKK